MASSESSNPNYELKVAEEIEEYLKSLNTEAKDDVSLKLKREKNKLSELVASYRQLCEKISKTEGAPPKELIASLPEIYAILHPELYRDVRDEEKTRLAQKFSTKRFYTEAEKVVPVDLTPVFTVQNKREKEIERFCRLVASAPSRFHNQIELTPRRTLAKPKCRTPIVPFRIKETEKERLARIFATSSSLLKENSAREKRVGKPCGGAGKNTVARGEMCKGGRVNQENINPLSPEYIDMVRLGEYSPLNANIRHERLRLGDEGDNRVDFSNVTSRGPLADLVTEETQTNAMFEPERRPRMSSRSTQTDESLSDCGVVETPSPSVQRHQQIPNDTPRAKLLSDLYGSSTYKFNSIQDIVQGGKQKQLAYAEALKQQIEEKKRIEEERKRKEREEEELIERRVREQEERLKLEYARDHVDKLDLMLQRQAQEDQLRQKLSEMNLEVKEIKRLERLRKLRGEDSSSSEPSGSRPISWTEPSQNNRKSPQEPIKYLQQRLPSPNWSSEIDQMLKVPGEDLLREYRTHKERLQVPPIQDPAAKIALISNENARPTTHYIPSTPSDVPRRSRSVNSGRLQAEAILRAPIDSYDPPDIDRPSSPVLPALRSETLFKRNSKLLDDKWQIPDGGAELKRTTKPSEPNGENVLTQLGAFRRQLAREHQRLEKRLRDQNT